MSTPGNKLANISAIDHEKIYLVNLLRIEFGFSASELSFLMGRHDIYVRNVEDPYHSLYYSVNENNYLIQIFNCSIRRILSEKVDPENYKVKLEFKEERKGLKLKIKNAVPEGKVSNYITELFDQGYFKTEKTALQVFQNCLSHFEKPLRPMHLAKAIRKYTAKRKSPRLITDKNIAKRKVYIED